MSRSILKPFLPLVGRAYRWRNGMKLREYSEISEDTKRLVELHRDALRYISHVDAPLLDEIEARRVELIDRQEPLVDGSLDTEAPWDVGVSVSQAVRASRAPRHARYLYGLVRVARPKHVLELGTNVGVSGAYIAAALKANADDGVLVSMDRSGYRQRLARELFDRMQFDNVHLVLGDFSETFDKTIAERDSFDFAFIDGNHQLEPTLHYADQLCKKSELPIDVVFDDIRWSDGMIEAWSKLRVDPRMAASLDLYNISICRMNQRHTGSPSVSCPLRAEFL